MNFQFKFFFLSYVKLKFFLILLTLVKNIKSDLNVFGFFCIFIKNPLIFDLINFPNKFFSLQFFFK